MTIELAETSTLTKDSNGSWLVVLAAPGKGMKGFYSPEVLEEKGPAAFPKGTRSYIGHALPQDRNAKDQLGKYPDGAYYSHDINPEKYPDGALVAKLVPRNKGYADMLDELGEDAEFSIYSHGDVDENGFVTDIYPNRWNSVDLVGYAGLEGSNLVTKLHESFVLDKPVVISAIGDKGKGIQMDKEFEDRFKALELLVTNLTTAVTPVAPKVEDVDTLATAKAEEIVDERIAGALDNFEEGIAAIHAAELLPSQVESLTVELKAGKDIKPLIESAVKIVTEAKALAGTSLVETVLIGDGSDRKVENWATSGMRVGA